MSFMLTLTLKRGAVTEALRAATGEFRVCRLDFNGPVIGTGEAMLARFDLGGYIEDVVSMASVDRTKGANLDTVILHGMYDATGAKLFSPSVICNVASI